MRLCKMEPWNGLDQSFAKDGEEWRKVYESKEPHKETFPGGFNELDSFKQMCIVRCIRADKVIPACRDFVAENLGDRFVEVPPFDLVGSYGDSAPERPVVFILSAGSDPMASLLKFGSEIDVEPEKIQSISLGQGQGPIAQEMIERGIKEGNWVVLQNCHLAVSWMTALEKIVIEIDPAQSHKDFRLWLTSYPSKDFPVTVLQNGVKITTEPPKGLKNNLLDSWMRDPIADVKFFEDCEKEKELKNMTFVLTFFHALIQERRNFGPLGWNIPYEFNESDLRISAQQLKMFIAESPPGMDLPYTALSYLTGECNYGGRVTDDQDRRTIVTILARFYHEGIHQPNFSLSLSGDYRVPPEGPLFSYVEYIKALPIQCQPEVFGMHENADITKDMKETSDMLNSILLTEGSGGGGGASSERDKTLNALATGILDKLPGRFDIDMIRNKYPVKYEESMNTVLAQECIRYNKLTDVIRHSLEQLRKAIVGLVVMSPDLDDVASDMFVGKVPGMWMGNSYPSLKPLGSYVTDLIERLKFLINWIAEGPPVISWISGIYFTQSFLTGALQNFARKHDLPIDTVKFTFIFMGDGVVTKKSPKPADGVYVNGLFFEGARFDFPTMQLAESMPKILFTEAPVIWMKPVKQTDLKTFPSYRCPVYREASRRGVLATTGHSSNFVMNIQVPTDLDPSHWVLRGVAMITQLSD
jgi:dynein heavy chain